MREPKDGIVIQEEIAKGASSDGRKGRDDDDPEEIQPPATSREHATNREDGNARQVEELKRHTSVHSAERSVSAAAGPARRRLHAGVRPCRRGWRVGIYVVTRFRALAISAGVENFVAKAASRGPLCFSMVCRSTVAKYSTPLLTACRTCRRSVSSGRIPRSLS